MQKFFDEEPSEDFKKHFFEVDENFNFEVSVAYLSVKNQKQAEKFEKEIGEYYIVNSPFFNLLDNDCEIYTQKVLTRILKKFVPHPPKKLLVVGLGNQAIDADAFGGVCVESIVAKKNTYLLKTDVYGNTNIMSFDIIKGVCQQIKPDLVIVLDSLATQNIKRLACSFQFCNVGILPGGALHDLNKTISSQTLGVPVVVIGVPFMLFATGLNHNLGQPYNQVILALKDTSEIVSRCGKIVSNAIMKVY